jgi:hypothetical protein
MAGKTGAEVGWGAAVSAENNEADVIPARTANRRKGDMIAFIARTLIQAKGELILATTNGSDDLRPIGSENTGETVGPAITLTRA